MAAYDLIAIIYNPNSTGKAQERAERLHSQLAQRDIESTLMPTDHAGHGRELAESLSRSNAHPLIVSVSGDGGYHDIINGLLASGNEQAVAAVIGAGNANDHYETLRGDGLVTAIAEDRPPTPIDLLEVTTDGSDTLHEYAHSYVGIGISARVAALLNKTKLNRWREMSLLFKGLFDHKPARLIINDAEMRVDSLICANINRMAKVFSFSSEISLQDGTFEYHLLPHQHVRAITYEFLRLALGRSSRVSTISSVTFRTVDTLTLQMDGELKSISGKTTVTIRSAPQRLLTLM